MLTPLLSYQAQRTPEEEGDYMAFEQLVAEAAIKKEKEKESKKKSKDQKAKDGKDGNDTKNTAGSAAPGSGSKAPGPNSQYNTAAAATAAADAPNVPREKA